ncbi:MAG: family 10 glycosylhydrolase [Oscillospiraceae bacterium]|nr:family 10 glycosylhydrolase [Oscillospiraceae bacterium]
MHRMTACLLAAVLLLAGCGREPEYWEQTLPQLAPEAPTEAAPQEEIRAVWIPVMHYAAWMTGRTEQQFRDTVAGVFADCAALGLNTVFVHVRAYGDAYYASTLFPRGAYLTEDYDPLAVMTEEAHARGLAVHAWINPLRCQTPEGLERTDKRYPLRQWYDDRNGTYLVEVDGHAWLNPAYPEVRQFVADGAAELLAQYDVEGLHIDDYFYPTTDAEFDAQAFAESGQSDLAAWRRENCTALIKLLYDTVKAQNPALVFSISPQGNPETNSGQLYADAARWCSEPGYCDWIVPQIYYGYRNAVCPFTATLHWWEMTADSSRLVIGLAAYKCGREDVWAGSGADEWLNDSGVLSRELAEVLAGSADGAAFYSCNDLFSDEAPMPAERERIRKILSHAVTNPAALRCEPVLPERN